MNRSDLVFRLAYSFHLESMNSVLCGRIDRLFTVLQLAAGSSVFFSLINYQLMGVVIVLISLVSVVYRFGDMSVRSTHQARRYKSLSIFAESKTDAELMQELNSIEDTDSTPFGVLKHAAFKRAAISLNLQDDTRLTVMEKFCAWLAGDLPV